MNEPTDGKGISKKIFLILEIYITLNGPAIGSSGRGKHIVQQN